MFRFSKATTGLRWYYNYYNVKKKNTVPATVGQPPIV